MIVRDRLGSTVVEDAHGATVIDDRGLFHACLGCLFEYGAGDAIDKSGHLQVELALSASVADLHSRSSHENFTAGIDEVDLICSVCGRDHDPEDGSCGA